MKKNIEKRVSIPIRITMCVHSNMCVRVYSSNRSYTKLGAR